jgi:hypothetical protein
MQKRQELEKYNVRDGSTSDLGGRGCEVRFALMNGHRRFEPSGPKSATGLNRSRGRALRRAAWPCQQWMERLSVLPDDEGPEARPQNRRSFSMMIARSIIDGVGSAPTVARRHLHRGYFEYPNRCDRRCSHDREWCIRRARNNCVGRCHVEIFVRPMRYKGCHQAHNAQVAICALFTTRNSLKLQGRRKVLSPVRKVRAISQKLCSHSGTTAVKSP